MLCKNSLVSLNEQLLLINEKIEIDSNKHDDFPMI